MSLEKYLSSKKAEAKLLEVLAQLPEEDRLTLQEVVECTSPSISVFREILNFSRQICARDKVTLRHIVESCLDKSLEQATVRLSSFRAKLFSMRYPERARLESIIAENLVKIKRNHNLSVKLPEELEGDVMKVELRFRNAEDLKKNIQRLESFSCSDELENISGILKGEL